MYLHYIKLRFPSQYFFRFSTFYFCNTNKNYKINFGILLLSGIYASDASVKPIDASSCRPNGARGGGALGELSVARESHALGRDDLHS